ncbi:hypothetical protein QUF93_00210 [Bacillus hominis]|uniref:hypothetical protein n=1 Tax=Bacillus hominis TaxID=2817478 RepID=UPI0025A2C9D9|nr:hypothetical protein [Bacillus hominis]MDM5191151.1 hypothetical protein [Bacillus hominis]
MGVAFLFSVHIQLFYIRSIDLHLCKVSKSVLFCRMMLVVYYVTTSLILCKQRFYALFE